MIRESDVFDALPPSGFVRSYVEAAQHWTDANVAYHLAGALTCLTQAVPIEYKLDYASPIFGNLYTLIVGESSKSRKTAAANIAQRIIRDSIENAIAETPGSDEALKEGLRHAPRQLVVYGEFGEFLAKAEEGYMMALKLTMTNLWDCVPLGRSTIKHGRKGLIMNPRLSMLCCVATTLLERHTESTDWTGGFLARFLTFHAEPEREFSAQPVPDKEVLNKLTQWLYDLSHHQGPVGSCQWIFPGSVEEEIWNDWHASMKPLREGANRRAAAACSRVNAIASKLALLLAWDVGNARCGEDWYIGETELVSALKIASLHLDSVLELGEKVTGSRDMRDRASVFNAIGLNPTPLGYIIRQSELLKRRALEIVDTLLEERTIERVSIGREMCFRRSPAAHVEISKIARPDLFGVPAGGDPNSIVDIHGKPVQTNVRTLRPPPPAIPIVPEADRLNSDDYFKNEEEINWSTYQE